MKYIFIIDQGHRVDTPGKRANGLREHEFNDDVAKRAAKKLQAYGEVHLTMVTERHPYSELTASGRSANLNYRTSKANQIYWAAVKKYGKGNFKIVFISIHANAHSNPAISGYEVFVYRHGGEAHELAKAVHRRAQTNLRVGTSIKDRGIKEGNFAVLRNTVMPAILIEHEFFTNIQAVKKLKDSRFREQAAVHILEGALDYMGIKQVKEELKVLYRVRKTWKDSKSQKGAYTVLENAIELAEQIGFNVYDETGKQVYPEKDHWAQVHYDNLVSSGIEIKETRFDDNITRGETFKLLDELVKKKII